MHHLVLVQVVQGLWASRGQGSSKQSVKRTWTQSNIQRDQSVKLIKGVIMHMTA